MHFDQGSIKLTNPGAIEKPIALCGLIRTTLTPSRASHRRSRLGSVGTFACPFNP